MDNIYLQHGNEQLGPFTEEKVRRYLDEGRVQATTLAWVEGAAEWRPIAEMLGLPTAPAVPAPRQQAPTYVVAQDPQSDPKKLILASWLMIGVTCLISLIPGIGFLTWLVAGPILLVTFIMGILTLSKGKTLQGVSILLVSLIAAPIFLVIAPIITTAVAVAGADSGSGRADFENALANGFSSGSGISESASEQPQAVPVIGDKVTMKDSEWEVVSARELGNVLEGGDFAEAQRSEGRFIYVQYKVTNNTAEEQAVLFTPSIRDSEGRKFEEINDLEFYLGENETGMTMEQLPSGIPKKFSAIFEVPANAKDFQFMARTFEAFDKAETGIKLGF